MKKMTTYRRRIAVALTVVFSLGQIGALIHFATVAHAICPHGQVVDADGLGLGRPGGPGSGNHGPDGHNHEGHDDCPVVAAITMARALASGYPVLPLFQLEMVPTEQPTIWEQLRSQKDIYRESPSNSPPPA
jgi:hypothetical protein